MNYLKRLVVYLKASGALTFHLDSIWSTICWHWNVNYNTTPSVNVAAGRHTRTPWPDSLIKQPCVIWGSVSSCEPLWSHFWFCRVRGARLHTPTYIYNTGSLGSHSPKQSFLYSRHTALTHNIYKDTRLPIASTNQSSIAIEDSQHKHKSCDRPIYQRGPIKRSKITLPT